MTPEDLSNAVSIGVERAMEKRDKERVCGLCTDDKAEIEAHHDDHQFIRFMRSNSTSVAAIAFQLGLAIAVAYVFYTLALSIGWKGLK